MSAPSPKRTPTGRQPRLTLVIPRSSGTVRSISDELLSLNQKWAAPLFQRPHWAFQYHEPPPLPKSVSYPYFNEFRLSSEEAIFGGKIGQLEPSMDRLTAQKSRF
jgi:hypothetical protein